MKEETARREQELHSSRLDAVWDRGIGMPHIPWYVLFSELVRGNDEDLLLRNARICVTQLRLPFVAKRAVKSRYLAEGKLTGFAKRVKLFRVDSLRMMRT